ncbi:MAG: hypothetical protein WC830_22165 [Burkholderiales bacterium]
MTRYPLAWPPGWQRTSAARRDRARFSKGERQYSSTPGGASWTRKRELTISDGTKRVLDALRILGVADGDAIISTNLQVRLDGLPRSGQSAPEDPGVAVYWQRAGDREQKCMAIDRYDRVADNLAAVAATLEAMRAIERHGGAQILDRAFTGFTALPAPGQTSARSWRDVLDVPADMPAAAQLERARMHYRAMASAKHPDKPGGSHAAMTELNAAWAQAQQAVA